MSQPPDPGSADILPRAAGFHIVRLITVGARSGVEREVEIWAHVFEQRLFLVGSNWGKPRQPAWYQNLVTNPVVRVEVGSTKHKMRARVAEREERERLFAVAVQHFPRYRDFAGSAGREIPIVVLESAG